jgi:hypothetical protein
MGTVVAVEAFVVGEVLDFELLLHDATAKRNNAIAATESPRRMIVDMSSPR